MKTFNRIAAAAGLLLSLSAAAYAQAPMAAKPMMAKKPAMSMMHRKGGYVKATTYMTKTGKMVHRKGFYRHAMAKPMMGKTMMAKKPMAK